MELSNVEGDEQVDRSNSQASYNISATYFVWIFHEHNSLPLEPIKPILHLSMEVLLVILSSTKSSNFALQKELLCTVFAAINMIHFARSPGSTAIDCI